MKEKEEDMRVEEEVSDSEEGDEKKEAAGKWREGLEPSWRTWD